MFHPTHSAYTYCAFLFGVLLTTAFAPFELSYLSVIALACLFWSWENLSAGKAALRGYVFGLGLFGTGVSWVYISVHDYGHASLIGSASVAATFVGFWAVFPALAGYLAVKLRFAVGHTLNLLIVPLAWILVEYMRSCWVLNGFPWLQVAYAQIATPLGGYIPVFGVYGTGFLVAFSAYLLMFVLKYRCKKYLLLTLLAGLWGIGSVLQSIQWTQPIGSPFKASLIQGNITQDQKWLPENRLHTLQTYKQLTQAHWDSQVIVWPESSIPAYLSEVDEFYITPLETEARQHGTDVIVSLPLQDETTDAIYNGVLRIGHERRFYKKTHLLPFGEYLPLQPLSGFVLQQLGIKLGNFTPGNIQQPFLQGGGYPFSTSICYEDAFGSDAIRNVKEAAYLVNVTNDGWFGDSIEPHQHLQIARFRALETGRYLLRATNTGATAVVNARGNIVKELPLFRTAVLTTSITPMGGMTPYARIGDAWIIGGLLAIMLGLMILKAYQWQTHK